MNSLPFANYALLLVGLGILLVVCLSVVLPNVAPTPWGRLNRQRRELRHRRYQLRQAAITLERARRNYAKLNSRAEHVRPQLLRKAEEQVEDMTTMLGHAEEKVMVAENHVRRVVMEEYPPVRQEQLLKQILPDAPDKKVTSHF